PVASNQKDHGRDARATRNDSDKTTQGESVDQEWPIPAEKLRRKLAVPSQGRLYYIRYAMKMGWTIEQIYELTKIDRWFLAQMRELTDFENTRIAQLAKAMKERNEDRELFTTVLAEAKALGYSDIQIAESVALKPDWLRAMRVLFALKMPGLKPVYKLVD